MNNYILIPSQEELNITNAVKQPAALNMNIFPEKPFQILLCIMLYLLVRHYVLSDPKVRRIRVGVCKTIKKFENLFGPLECGKLFLMVQTDFQISQ